jgi:hypothetical protein
LDISRRSAALAVAVAIGSALGSTSATGQTREFDGQWSVQVHTDKGDCEKVYRYPVVIQNGAVRYGGAEDFAASGSVGANGAIRGSITRDDLRADVTGRLSGKSGGGTWRTTGGCSGSWNAEKRG